MKIICFPLALQENMVIKHMYGFIERSNIELEEWRWKPRFQKFDVFHVHWPDATVMGKSKPRAAFKVFLLLLSAFVFKLRGAKIVQHVHNIGSHDKLHPYLEKIMWRCFLPMVDCFVHLNTASITTMKEYWPFTSSQRHEVIFPPSYERMEPIKADEKSKKRQVMGFNDKTRIFLNFGLIRPYKGVEDLIDAFKKLDGQNNHLVILGRPFDEYYKNTLIDKIDNDPSITYEFSFVSDEVLSDWLAISDVVVMSHRKLNNSGVALKTLAGNSPVIAPAIGAIPELADLVGENWVTLFAPPISAEDLSKFELPKTDSPNLDMFDSDVVGKKLLDVFMSFKKPN